MAGCGALPLERIYEPIAADLELVEAGLERQIRSLAEQHEKLIERHAYLNRVVAVLSAMRGKLLRPALVLFSGRAVAGAARPTAADSPLITLAVAAELVHAASLIHDDIIDRALVRRSHTALYREFGTAIAVLVGDVLYAQFFTLISELPLPAAQRLRLVQLFCAVTKTMSQAEIFQHGAKRYDLDLTIDDYLAIIRSKTAALMSACCAAGALAGGGSEAQFTAAGEFGLQFGLVFQLIDDRMDRDAPAADGTYSALRAHTARARTALAALPAGESRTALDALTDFVLTQHAAEVEQVSIA